MSARDDYPAVAVLADAWAARDRDGLAPEAVRMLAEIERLRAAERFETYKMADGGEFADACWWNTPDLFEESDWDERTEVIHETWALVARESIWYGPTCADDEDGAT